MKGFKAVKAMKREDVMINTVGLLLCPGTEFELSSKASVDDIVDNWKYLRKQKKYFPAIELLPDKKLKIEFCPAKVKYEQNLYEIAPGDILQILVLLNTLLGKAHVNTCPAILFYAHVYRIDYSKVCYMPFSSQTLWSCLQDIHKGGHYKQAFSWRESIGSILGQQYDKRRLILCIPHCHGERFSPFSKTARVK